MHSHVVADIGGIPVTPADLQAIEARADAASGPWKSSGRGVFREGSGFQVMTMPATVQWAEDTRMVIETLNRGEAARQDIPALLAEVRRLQELARVQTRALLEVEWHGGTIGRVHHCPACRGAERHCADYDGERIADACPLDAALSAAGLSTQAQRDEARHGPKIGGSPPGGKVT